MLIDWIRAALLSPAEATTAFEVVPTRPEVSTDLVFTDASIRTGIELLRAHHDERLTATV